MLEGMIRPRAGVFSSCVLLVLGAASLHCLGEDVAASADPTDAGGGGSESDAPPSTSDVDGSSVTDGAAPPPPLEDAVAVTAGRAHTCALTATQDVLCWGSNASGQLGIPQAQAAQSSRPVRVDLGGKAVAVAAGGNHTCAALTDGNVKCWGNNEKGQLGRGTVSPSGLPDLVSAPTVQAFKTWWVPSTKAVQLSAGAAHTCVGMDVGTNTFGLPGRRFFCWGENITRQLATESTNGSPSLVPYLITPQGDGATNVGFEGFAVSAGDAFSCAGVYGAAGAAVFSVLSCWGSRSVGQIGAPALANAFEVNPQRWPRTQADGGGTAVFGEFAPQLLATGAAHGCVRFGDGTQPVRLTCWGNNTKGQTGSSVTGARTVEKLTSFDATSVNGLAAGGETTCVVASGQTKCIGANESGQLGRGTVDTAVNATFADVKIPPTASAIAVGVNHACAVLGSAPGQKGQVACWGLNQNGQLGDGMNVETGYPGANAGEERLRSTPVRVLAPK